MELGKRPVNVSQIDYKDALVLSFGDDAEVVIWDDPTTAGDGAVRHFVYRKGGDIEDESMDCSASSANPACRFLDAKGAYKYLKMKVDGTLPPNTESTPARLVRAVDGPQFSHDDLFLVARVLFSEATRASSGERGHLADVMYNRIHSSLFPNTMGKMVRQKNAFTCINDPHNKQWAKSEFPEKLEGQDILIWEECFNLAWDLMNGTFDPDRTDILFYLDHSMMDPPLHMTAPHNQLLAEVLTDHFTFFSVAPRL